MNKQQSSQLEENQYDFFHITVGDTERNIEDILGSIRSSDLPVIQIKQISASASRTGSGATLSLRLAPEGFSEEDVKRKLNEYGGCVYQIDSVEKKSK